MTTTGWGRPDAVAARARTRKDDSRLRLRSGLRQLLRESPEATTFTWSQIHRASGLARTTISRLVNDPVEPVDVPAEVAAIKRHLRSQIAPRQWIGDKPPDEHLADPMWIAAVAAHLLTPDAGDATDGLSWHDRSHLYLKLVEKAIELATRFAEPEEVEHDEARSMIRAARGVLDRDPNAGDPWTSLRLAGHLAFVEGHLGGPLTVVDSEWAGLVVGQLVEPEMLTSEIALGYLQGAANAGNPDLVTGRRDLVDALKSRELCLLIEELFAAGHVASFSPATRKRLHDTARVLARRLPPGEADAEGSHDDLVAFWSTWVTREHEVILLRGFQYLRLEEARFPGAPQFDSEFVCAAVYQSLLRLDLRAELDVVRHAARAWHASLRTDFMPAGLRQFYTAIAPKRHQSVSAEAPPAELVVRLREDLRVLQLARASGLALPPELRTASRELLEWVARTNVGKPEVPRSN